MLVSLGFVLGTNNISGIISSIRRMIGVNIGINISYTDLLKNKMFQIQEQFNHLPAGDLWVSSYFCRSFGPVNTRLPQWAS